MNRYQAMLDAGYEPGKTYGSEPLCFCGKRAEYLVRSYGSQLEHKCEDHYRAYRQARSEGR